MTTFILVPGAWHGGWWWQPVVERLTAAGHRAVPVTPAGLAEGDELAGQRAINLDTHVQQVLDQARATGQDDLVLVGHSYGGSVINQVADQVPQQIAALVHLDSDVLENGESCYTFTTPANREYFLEAVTPDGLGVAPLPFFDERARPHPLATLLQPTRLSGAWKTVPVKHFVAALETPGGLQAPESMRRVSEDPAWRYEEWPVRHNVLAEGPERVTDLLLRL
ncbi:esterase [Kineosporia sp. NBRC 101677]|uniref:alpha/beta fold hydrolase n=1 Tax=Kineosporia sp. NBRC 101677 TaxID=3032197 RepID=UPI0024A034A3|nr:alpha/beta hydrolase [Kineosporia sp. NBRC 101677]GLY15968.1 esterase [Kineosporia sp. NBRC 101677]